MTSKIKLAKSPSMELCLRACHMIKNANFFLLVLWMGVLMCWSRSATAQPNAPNTASTNAKATILAFASDTQAPLFIEKLIRKTDHNEKATEMIFTDVVANRPSALFILGDVVSLGYSDAKWKNMDRYLKWCADDSIPVYAALGNHELLLHAAEGMRKFQTRFPMHHGTGYFEIIDSVAVLLMNSNFDKMTASDIAEQDSWYGQTITAMDSDPAVKFIVVGCHHSPYTNSKVVGPSLQVQQKFVPGFIRSKKCVLFLSGHSHNFERFNVQGKYFLVIGGGGGPYQPLYRHKELTKELSPDYKPRFHYLEIQRCGASSQGSTDSLQVISRALKPDLSGFKIGLAFAVAAIGCSTPGN